MPPGLAPPPWVANASKLRNPIMDRPILPRPAFTTIGAMAEASEPTIEIRSSAAAGEAPRDAVEEVLEQFLGRAASGTAVSIEVFARRLEKAADRLRLMEAHELLARGLPSRGAPGEVLAGRYRVVRELGRGGFGVVYEAHDEELDRRVALKAIRAAGPEELARLEQSLVEESRSLARVASRDIVAVHDVVRDEDRIFLVLELVRGADLGTLLASVRRSVEEKGPRVRLTAFAEALGSEAIEGGPADWYQYVAQVVLRLARALLVAHEAGVLHRDLKPSNVLLEPGGEPKLVDFGLAYRAGSRADEESLAGTPEYLAPEQVSSGRSGASRSTDIYGLGLVAYEMLALERAFRRRKDEGLPQLFQRIARGERVRLEERDPRLPRALAAIVEHALELDPARRYASMEDLAADLERFLAGRPPRYAPLAAGDRLAMDARWLLRNPRTWAAVFLLAAVGGLGLGLLVERPPLVVQSAQVFRTAEGVVRPLADGDRVTGSDDLGVRVAGGRGGVLYTLSVFERHGSDREYLMPTRPLRLDRYEESSSGFGLRLPAGDHDVIVAVVSPENRSEGIEVYSCDAERPLFEEWLSELETIAMAEGAMGGVERSRAEALLERLSSEMRGGSPSARDLARRREAYEEIRRSRDADAGAVRLFRRSFQVAP
jgi:tRNA A-37 threonylcarbamoyl transferase component Bud32